MANSGGTHPEAYNFAAARVLTGFSERLLYL